MKLVVIGGNPAGLSAASAVKRSQPDWDVIVYEMGKYISYGSCGLPYLVSGVVESEENLFTLTPEILEKKRNIPVKLFHRVENVDFNNKKLKIRNLQSNSDFEDNYDYLMIATGAKPREKENISIDHPRIFKIHVIKHALYIKKMIETGEIKSGILIGAGYIGLEMIESYNKLGIKDLTLIGPRPVFSSKSKEYIIKELEKNGINVVFDKYVKEIIPLSKNRLQVIMEDGQKFESDFIQVAIGVVPNTDMFKNTNLEMQNSAIITNEYMQTNIPNVYAAGDCCAVYHQLLEKKTYIPLAPAANKQGKIAGNHIAGKEVDPYPGVIGTSIFKVFDLHCAKTGINIVEALQMGYNAESILIENNEIAHYYPNKGKMSVLLVFDIETHKLLGAEITATKPLGAKKIDVLATVISANLKIEDIQNLDLAYAPPFAPVWDPILIAANIARKKCK